MKIKHLILCLIFGYPFFTQLLYCEDWTVKGKEFHNISILNSDPDVVSIMYDGGIAHFPLADLPTDLQKRFHYDPAKAAVAATARAAQMEQEEHIAAQAQKRVLDVEKTQGDQEADDSKKKAVADAKANLAIQISQIQDQIAVVNADLEEKRRHTSGTIGTGYRDIIQSDRNALTRLGAQLSELRAQQAKDKP